MCVGLFFLLDQSVPGAGTEQKERPASVVKRIFAQEPLALQRARQEESCRGANKKSGRRPYPGLVAIREYLFL